LKKIFRLISYLYSRITSQNNRFNFDHSFKTEIEANELLSHFIFFSSLIRKDSDKPKPAAFTINTARRDMSSYRIKELNENQIWDIEKRYVSINRSDKKISKARADFNIEIIKNYKSLKLNPDGNPMIRHCNIENFPSDKVEQKAIQVELANQSTLIINPNQSPLKIIK